MRYFPLAALRVFYERQVPAIIAVSEETAERGSKAPCLHFLRKSGLSWEKIPRVSIRNLLLYAANCCITWITTNGFQKVALQTRTEATTEASFEIGPTAGYGTSVQPLGVRPTPASSQLDASKCWSKSCKASLVWGCFSAEFTVTARLPGRGWLTFSWLRAKGERAQVSLQRTEQPYPSLSIAHLRVSVHTEQGHFKIQYSGGQN